MKMQSKEYDAFGPWILIVGKEHKLPRLFADYQKDADSSLMMIKIPRHIERRDANPNMHLYDAVIGVFDTHLLVLNRVGSKVREQRVAIKDVEAIRHTTCLLRGELTLYTDSRDVEIVYNAVSEHIMMQMANLILSLKNQTPKSLGLAPMSYDIDTIAFLYVNLINGMKRDDANIKLVAYQPDIEVTRRRKALGGVWSYSRRYMLCTAFLTNDRELIFIEQSHKATAKQKETDYAYSYVYLPLGNIESVKIKQDEAGQRYLVCATRHHQFAHVFDARNDRIQALKHSLTYA